MVKSTRPPAAPGATKKSEKGIRKLQLKNTSVGQVFVVGSGDCGQLGLGQDVLERERLSALNYFADHQIVAVYAGGLHNIALSAGGKLFSWGCNDQKALGRTGEETEPGPVHGLDGQFVVHVACGDSVSCCLTQEGQVYAWGTFRNNTGIFGFAPGIEQQETPMLIPELKGIVHIAAGTNHLVAISDQGKIYTWGVGEQGQLGRKVTPRQMIESSLRPRPINFKPHRMSAKFTSAYCGAYHTFVVHESHKLFAFGLNNHGQLGVGDLDEHDLPELVEGLGNGKIVQVEGGEHHSLVLDDRGQVYVFGRGDSGQLGLEDKESKSTAHLLPSLEDVSGISAGASFSLATTNAPSDNLYAWGYGEMGQLANESQDADVPFQVAIKSRHVIQAAAGGQHTVLLLSPRE